MIAAPLPESRLVSRITFAPSVIACSACERCVAGSPWALLMMKSSSESPAALNASPKKRRSAFSQRSEDLVSGSSTAILPLSSFPPPPAGSAESSSPPQAAAPSASSAAAVSPRILRMPPSLVRLLKASRMPGSAVAQGRQVVHLDRAAARRDPAERP